jgi:NADH:ubiquinone oxidoreductase subunit 5 (subunit L)/multisubunit Na+/H+ antiporter MnhA subunit
MGRHWIYIFLGEGRTEDALNAIEAPRLMRIPLVTLAVGSIFIGFINTPFFNGVEKMLEEILINVKVTHPPEGINFIILASISVLAGVVGLFISNILFIQKITNPLKQLQEFPLIPKKIRDKIVKAFSQENTFALLLKSFFLSIKKLSLNGLYLDLYGKKFLVDGSKSFSRFIAVSIDQLLIDGSVNNLAKIPAYISKQIKPLQSGYIRPYLTVFGIMVLLLIALLVLPLGGLL